ncbi:MAG: zinc ribbon domain-containing protein [Myxococcota bacterium]
MSSGDDGGQSGKGDEGKPFSEPVYEMFWDCEYCGAEKLLGVTHRHCPQCGAAQNPQARYFPPDEEKVAVQNHVYVGADWHCESCGTPNSNKAEFCTNCGTPKDGSSKVKLAHEREEKKAPPPSPPPQASSGGGGGIFRYIMGCGCVGIIGMILLGIVSMFWTRSDSATVLAHSWEYTIQIEEYAAASGDGWCDSMPSKAYDVSRRQKQRDTRRVQRGETCRTKNVDNGDGTFRQVQECTPNYVEEPILDDYCSYTVDKWTNGRLAKASGADLSPQWPQTNVRACSRVALGCLREGTKSASHIVKLKDSGGTTHDCTVSESRWRALKDGTRLDVQKKVIGGGLDCSSI